MYARVRLVRAISSTVPAMSIRAATVASGSILDTPQRTSGPRRRMTATQSPPCIVCTVSPRAISAKPTRPISAPM